MTTIAPVDTAGVVSILDPATYIVDTWGGQIVRALDAVWPTDAVRWIVRLVCGTEAAAVPPRLLFAIGLLTAHYATLGRDLASIDVTTEIPYGYEDSIAPYVPVALA